MKFGASARGGKSLTRGYSRTFSAIFSALVHQPPPVMVTFQGRTQRKRRLFGNLRTIFLWGLLFVCGWVLSRVAMYGQGFTVPSVVTMKSKREAQKRIGGISARIETAASSTLGIDSDLHDSEERLERLEKMPPVDTDGISGGVMYRIPSKWNRLDTLWFQPPRVRTLTPKESNHRYLYAATRIATSDGIGHSMGVVNFEVNLALRMNLTYTHRVGLYSSLTANNRFAVEDFFGWGTGEFPRLELQREGCVPKGGKWPDEKQIYVCHICASPLLNGSLEIKNLVDIPDDLAGTCDQKYTLHGCKWRSEDFTSKFSDSHTIFQAPVKRCNPPATDSNLLNTKHYFFHKYWKQHGQFSLQGRSSSSEASKATRLRHEELNIAIHVRRGDFLEPEVQAKRSITKDLTFARVLCNVLSVIEEHGGIFAQMPIAVHIYSEGILRTKKVLSVHDVDMQDQEYYDSDGISRNGQWWQDMLLNIAAQQNFTNVSLLGSRLHIQMHISEDTLTCLHEMVSADLFIGSRSGLSTSLVWSVARGIVLIPHTGTINTEVGKKGKLCCSIPFNNKDGDFDADRLKGYWSSYARANADSAKHAVTSSTQSAPASDHIDSNAAG